MLKTVFTNLSNYPAINISNNIQQSLGISDDHFKNLMYQMKIIKIFILILFILFINYTAADSANELSGPGFSDPSEQIQMPGEWEKQSIKHDPSVSNIDLAINLDQQMYRILLPATKAYAMKNGLKITITDSTCGNSAGMLRRKMIDVGGFCCAPGAMDRLPGIRFHTTGIAPVAIFVHPDNPIDNITLEQARKIFMGEISSWSELKTSDGKPGPNVLIRTIGRLHCKTRPGHWRLLLDNEDLFSPRLLEVGNIPDMVSQVAANPDAIGHETVWLATKYYEKRGRVKTLKINGYTPENLDALLSGHYPIYKSFNLTTWDSAEAKNVHAEKLVNYLKNHIETLDAGYGILSSSKLKKSGWKFNGTELIAEPN